MGIDTSHIVAVMSARVTADGKIELDCRHSSESAPAPASDDHAQTPAPSSTVESDDAAKAAQP
jgi:hypothetical protein